MRAENVVRGDAASAEPAENHRHLHRLATQLVSRRAKADLARPQPLEMQDERVAYLRSRLKAMFRFVFNRADEQLLHLARERRVNLSRSRILCEVKDQQWIILRV